MKNPTHNDMLNDLYEMEYALMEEAEQHNLDREDTHLDFIQYEERLEDYYNEQPTFEETLDALWDGKLEYNTEEQ